MANQALINPNRALDSNSYSVPGATATFYASGTMTLIPVYSDSDGTIATTNPVIAHGDGVFPQTYYDGAAKVIVRDSGGATLWTLDPVPGTSADSTGAANVSFTPTVDVPETNVQAAIEAVAASVITGATDFGLGITGNAPTISNIDATAQASGVYRFTAASTGTFPSGITASTTGLIRLDRQTSGEAIMFLRAAGQSRLYVRYLVAGAWGAWREDIVLAPPGADRIPFWDQSAGQYDFLTLGDGVSITGTTITAANPVKAWANFHGIPTAGTYSRTGTLVTVTMTAHGMSTGQGVFLDFTSGGATDGFYTITVTDANTFTITDSASGATSGNVSRNIWVRAAFNVASIVRNVAGSYTVTMTNAVADGNYAIMGTAEGRTNHPGMVVAVFGAPTTTAFTVLVGLTGASSVTGTQEDNARINVLITR